MPGQFLALAERMRLSQFPAEISAEELITFFHLTADDLAQIPVTSALYNRLGFALQLCTLRYLGFCPDDLQSAPPSVVTYLAYQLGMNPQTLVVFVNRKQTHLIIENRPTLGYSLDL